MDNKNFSAEKEKSNKKLDAKIELVNCRNDCRNCKTILADINRFFAESEQYQADKEYQFSILALKKAFDKTHELTEPFEHNCAQLFRKTIIESLESISRELAKMTSGFFRKRRYQKSYLMAKEMLSELKEELPAGKERNLKAPAPTKNRKNNFNTG